MLIHTRMRASLRPQKTRIHPRSDAKRFRLELGCNSLRAHCVYPLKSRPAQRVGATSVHTNSAAVIHWDAMFTHMAAGAAGAKGKG